MLWLDEQLKAQGLQAGIRSVVNVKDSLTGCGTSGIPSVKRLQAWRAERERVQSRRERLGRLRQGLCSLFAESVPHKCGSVREGVLTMSLRQRASQ